MATNLSGAHDPDKTTVGIPGQTYTNTVEYPFAHLIVECTSCMDILRLTLVLPTVIPSVKECWCL